MDHPGLDPNTALELIQNLFYWIACILGGSLFLGLSAYIVFLCLEIFSPQPCSKSRLAKVPHPPIDLAPVAEANLELVAAETAILAEAERLGGEAVRVPSLSHDAKTPMTLVAVTLESEPIRRWGFLEFLRFRRAAVPQRRRPSLRANAQLEKLA